MKHLILALALILPLSVEAYDPKHLKQLKETDQCPKCDLEGAYLRGAYLEYVTLWKANLEGAYLEGAYLEGANLSKANLNGANLKGAAFYNTTMPDGSVNNSDSVYTPDCE